MENVYKFHPRLIFNGEQIAGILPIDGVYKIAERVYLIGTVVVKDSDALFDITDEKDRAGMLSVVQQFRSDRPGCDQPYGDATGYALSPADMPGAFRVDMFDFSAISEDAVMKVRDLMKSNK